MAEEFDPGSDLPESWGQPPEQAVSGCVNHPAAAPAYQCSVCRSLLCEACVNSRIAGNLKIQFCSLCGGACGPAGGGAAVADGLVEQSFFASLPGAFAYPFKRQGIVILVAGMIFFALIDFLGFIPLVGLLLGLIATAYLGAYLITVISTSARGDAELPPWPDLADVVQDLVVPCLMLAGTLLFCLGPFVLAGFLEKAGPFEGYPWVKWVLLGFGGLYLPMALTAVALFDSLVALNPLLIVPSILKVAGDYVAACLLFGLIAATSAVSNAFLPGTVPVLGYLVTGFISLYCLVVEMRILGLLYYTNRERLGWF